MEQPSSVRAFKDPSMAVQQNVRQRYQEIYHESRGFEYKAF
jgi:hypothetical protein